MVPVRLNGDLVEALVDMECGWMLVRHAEGDPLVEMLQFRCIHGDAYDYPTVMAQIPVAGWRFWCAVGVVPHLDSPMLRGHYCPILNQLLQENIKKSTEQKERQHK